MTTPGSTLAGQPVCLALQGGGSYGAFAWGVLDRLLEAGMRPVAISGVSSGALSGVALSQGWAEGGADGARAALRDFWQRVGRSDTTGSMRTVSQESWMPGWDAGTRAWQQGMEAAMMMFSPAQLNPLGHNPLRGVIEETLDRACLASAQAIPITVFATDVETGTATGFDNRAITVEALLASSCLPFLFQPVEIAGRAYWDGGYAGNPPLAPLLRPGLPERIVLVRAQSRRRSGIPSTANEIVGRMQDIAFQAVLDAELVALPSRVALIDVDGDDALAELPPASRLDTSPRFLERLFAAGRDAARAAIL